MEDCRGVKTINIRVGSWEWCRTTWAVTEEGWMIELNLSWGGKGLGLAAWKGGWDEVGWQRDLGFEAKYDKGLGLCKLW